MFGVSFFFGFFSKSNDINLTAVRLHLAGM